MTQVSTTLFRLNLDYFRKNFLNQKTWGEKDTKLFCDFLGLKYTPSSDIEKYKKYLGNGD